jgi:hypothetical protein
MASLSLRCELRERGSIAGLCGGMTASGTCGLSGCFVWEYSHTVLRVSDSMQCADWLFIGSI